MAPVDPSQLLKALNPLLGQTGEIKGPTEAVRIASLMKDAVKLVSRCIYINVLKITEDNETMEKFLTVGGWDTLNDWLQDIKEDENYPVLVELLKVYQNLPVSVDILKTNNAAKTIKQLCKSENEGVKNLADSIFAAWMKKVKGNNNNNNESKSKKKKKDKEKERDKDKDRDKEKEKSSSKNREDSEKDDERIKSKDTDRDSEKQKSKESKQSSSGKDTSSSSQHKHKDSEKDKGKERTRNNSTDSESSVDTPSVKQGSGLKIKIKLGGEKTTEQSNKEKSVSSDKANDKSDRTGLTNDSKKRASTVKRPPSKFRSTGLEEENMLPPKSKPSFADALKPIPKRSTGSEEKMEPPIKRSRLHVTVPPPSLPPVITTPTGASPSPTSPGEMHGRIKLIPARPKSNHEIHESTGFMESLEKTSTRTYGQFKKKKKALAAAAAAGQTPGQKSPTTPPSPVSPTTAVARSLPTVPSFYKDTQEDEPSTDKTEIKKEIKKERSPSPEEEKVEGVEAKIEDTVTFKQEIKEEPMDTDTGVAGETETEQEDIKPSVADLDKEGKGLLTTGATKKKKHKKRVSWKDDSEIKQIFYFELDEDERENVNRPKDFNLAKKNEMMMDRKAMESGRRLINDPMIEQLPWYRPKLIAGVKPFDYGKESQEREIQRVREQGVLQALFFDKTMLPGAPAEPELEHEEVIEPKTIPLEDSSGSDEYLYNYEEHAQPLPAQQTFPPPNQLSGPPTLQLQPPMGPPPMGPPPMGGPPPLGPPPMGPPPGPMSPPVPMGPGLNLPPGVQLPPDVADLLNMLQNKAMNPSDPLMQNVQQILNNIMGGGNEHSFEQLQQIMTQQMNMMQGPPPGPPPPMGPGGPRMGPPPTGLLGNAPPGFRPMGPPPPGFGPPPVSGPGGPNNQNWGQNMGGGPPRGPNMGMPGGPNNQGGFNPQPFGGRMQGPGPRGWGRGGPRFRGRGPKSSKVCRHFLSNGCQLGNNCYFQHIRPSKKDDSKRDGPPKLDRPGSSPPQNFDGPPPKLKQERNSKMSPPR